MLVLQSVIKEREKLSVPTKNFEENFESDDLMPHEV